MERTIESTTKPSLNPWAAGKYSARGATEMEDQDYDTIRGLR